MPLEPRSQTRLERHVQNHFFCFTCEFHLSLSSESAVSTMRTCFASNLELLFIAELSTR